MNQRSWYVFSLCREKALRGELQLMMVREPAFHAQMLVEGAFRALIARTQGPITIVRQPLAQAKIGMKQRRRRR